MLEQQITEFFQLIYDATRGEIPDFLKHAHEFDVRYALRNLDDPATPAILAKEDTFRIKTTTLRAAYEQTIGLVNELPEPLKVTGLHVASEQLPDTMTALGLSDAVQATALQALKEILEGHPAPTTEQLQQVVAVIENG